MDKIIKVGNLTVFGERNFDNSYHLDIVNGCDIVYTEHFYGGSIMQAVNRALHAFDIYTMHDILAAIASPASEHNGRLISGQICGFTETEYFKQIDDTPYYKHYTHRPKM